MARQYGEVGDKLTTALGCQRGLVLLQSGQHDDAVAQLERTLLEVNPGAQNDIYSSDCRVLRGHAMAVRGDFELAERTLDGSIETLQQTGEPGRPHLAQAFAYRARLALYRGDADAAERFRKALQIRESLHGEHHYRVHLLRCELGRALVAQGETEQGSELIRAASTELEQQFGTEHGIYKLSPIHIRSCPRTPR